MSEQPPPGELGFDLASVLDNARDAIGVDDPDGNVVYANRAFRRLFRLSPDEALGRLDDYVVPAWRPRLQKAHEMRMSGQPVADVYEFEARRRDGTTFWGEVSVVPLGEEGAATLGTQAIIRDVTARRNQRGLMHAQRMRAVGRLAAGVAHEFNNILGAVVGSSEAILDELDGEQLDSTRTRGLVGEVMARCAAGRGVVRELLTFSRAEAGHAEVIPVDQRLSAMASWLSRLLGESVGLSVNLDAPEVWVELDPRLLEQVVLNLALNARDAMGGSGTVRIETRIRDPNSVELAVVDNGPGIDPDIAPHVFEPFFTTKEQGDGTGLGLASVYAIVEAAGGQVELISTREGHPGTRVRIVLPTCGPPAANADCGPQWVVSSLSGNILVVDDEPLIRDAVATALQRNGCRVTLADGPSAARARLAEDRYDLVLSDISMPGGTGPELAREFLRSVPGLRVLFMSGYLDAGVQGVAPEHKVLLKPFTRDQLLQAVGEVLAG